MMSQQCAKEGRGKTPDRRRINKIYFSIVGAREINIRQLCRGSERK